MGLKTNNCYIKSLNYTFPTAYAILERLDLQGTRGTAVFAIQQTREMAKKNQPFETVFVEFEWDRKENPIVSAYNAAKTQVHKKMRRAEGTNETIVEVELGILYGWQDDIV
jgi:hypothetical protein